MKTIIQLTILSTLVTSQVSANSPLVVYGKDNRHEVYSASAAHQALAKSTAVMIKEENISLDKNGLYQLNQQTLSESLADTLSVCEDMRFAEQPDAGNCSGFLIAPDLIVTAGHCVSAKNPCLSTSWVFDFQLDKKSQTAGINVSPDDVYKCKRVVSQAEDIFAETDYALIQLERPVKGRTPLRIRNRGEISTGQSVLAIGNPSGLPTKIANSSHVRPSEHPDHFETDLDTFAGNSGSAVFNADTNVVEGILVSGDEDYIENQKKMCIEVNVCPQNGCKGETVSRITSIPEVFVQAKLNEASRAGDLKTLLEIFKKKTWPDFNTVDGETALMKASAAAQVMAMNLLIDRKADVNAQDAKGNTPLHHLVGVLNKNSKVALDTLILAKAKLEVPNKKGETPLMMARNKQNLEAVELLIAVGVKN